MSQPASKFPTSIDVYNRLRTDTTFLPHLAVLSYVDSTKDKLIDIPLASFRPIAKGGDVPWHRIHQIKYKGVVIWDRDKKLCGLDSTASEQANDVISLPDEFQVLSYNVLNEDSYPVPGLKPAQKVHRMHDLLRSILAYDDVDVVCLQEVSTSFLTHLGAVSAVAAKYPFRAHTTGLDQNILILSKATIVESRVIEFAQSTKKQALMVRVQDEREQPIDFVGVHLTSNSQPQAKQKRIDQYLQVQAAMHNSARVVLLGDFNSSAPDCMPASDTSDAGDYSFRSANGDEEYTSFDPTTNPLAKRTSVNQLRQSCDKIFVRGNIAPNGFHVDTTNLLSDHYPVRSKCVLLQQSQYEQTRELFSLRTLTPDHTTALVVLPPLDFWPVIHEIRSRGNDPTIDRWMPHITLAHGFVPLGLFAAHQVDLLAQRLLHIDSFDIRLDRFASFDHQVTTTHFAEPDTPTSKHLQHLFAACQQLLPTMFSGKLHPHLTLGKQAPVVPAAPAASPLPWSWRCDALYVLQKTSHAAYYQVVRKLQLHSPNIRQQEGRIEVQLCHAHRVRDLLTRVVGGRWEIGGSCVFEAVAAEAKAREKNEEQQEQKQQDSAASDIDLVVFTDATPDDFFSRLVRILHTCAEFTLSAVITSSHGTYVKTHLASNLHPVDIHLASTPVGLAVYEEARAILRAFASDADRLLFVRLLGRVKEQARRCGVYGAATGFVPGVGWAILTACACLASRSDPTTWPSSMELATLFGHVRLDRPIRLGCSHDEPSPALVACPADRWMVIGTTSDPFTNVVRTMTRSTRDVLVRALACGLDASREAAVACERTFVLSIVCREKGVEHSKQLCECEAMLKELLPNFLIRLDKKVSFVRPGPITGSLLARKLAWTLGYNDNTDAVQHYGDKLRAKLILYFANHLSIE